MVSQKCNLKDLTIERLKQHLKAHSYIILFNPGGELFQNENGFTLDVQSINVICLVHDNLKPENQVEFNSVLQSEYRFAGLLDKMWTWVK